MAVVVASLAPLTLETPVEESDKIGHLLAYGGLMYWFGMLAQGPRARAVWAAFLVTLGVSLEYAQSLIGYRTFEFADMMANTLGVGCGWLIARSLPGQVLNWVERTWSAS